MRHHHFHAAMVTVAMGMALASASFVHLTDASYAAPRNPLAIRADETTLPDIMLPSQTGVIVERFVLRAGREDMFVDTLSFRNCISDANDNDGDCADTGEAPGNDDAIAAIALLYNDGANNRKTRGTLVDGIATFPRLALTLPAGVDVPVSVRIATSAISDAAPSGAQFQLHLNAIGAPLHGVIRNSAVVVSEAHVRKNVMGSVHTLRQSFPTLALSATSPSGFIDDGWTEVFRTDLSASSGGNVSIDALTFKLAVTKPGGGNWDACAFLGASEASVALVDTATGETVPATWGMYDANGTACAASEGDLTYLTATFTTPLSVATNPSSYALFLDTTYANTEQHDALRVTLPTEAALADLATPLPAITWSDGTTAGSDLNGSALETLPVTGNPLVF